MGQLYSEKEGYNLYSTKPLYQENKSPLRPMTTRPNIVHHIIPLTNPKTLTETLEPRTFLCHPELEPRNSSPSFKAHPISHTQLSVCEENQNKNKTLSLQNKIKYTHTEMAKRLIPSLNRVLVEKILPPTKTNTGILLPEKASKVFFTFYTMCVNLCLCVCVFVGSNLTVLIGLIGVCS